MKRTIEEDVKMSTITISRICPFCGNVHTMAFDKQQLEDGMRKHEAGALIQDAFPGFTPDEREFILTGICSACWSKM